MWRSAGTMLSTGLEPFLTFTVLPLVSDGALSAKLQQKKGLTFNCLGLVHVVVKNIQEHSSF